MFVPLTQSTDFFLSQNDHQDKYNYSMSPYKGISYLLSAFPVLYISFPWLIHFASGSSYLLISLTYFFPHPNPEAVSSDLAVWLVGS